MNTDSFIALALPSRRAGIFTTIKGKYFTPEAFKSVTYFGIIFRAEET